MADQTDVDLNEVATALEGVLGESDSTKLVWKPTTSTEMDLESMTKLMKLVDALEDDDDVQRVTTNFEASDEVMGQLCYLRRDLEGRPCGAPFAVVEAGVIMKGGYEPNLTDAAPCPNA